MPPTQQTAKFHCYMGMVIAHHHRFNRKPTRGETAEYETLALEYAVHVNEPNPVHLTVERSLVLTQVFNPYSHRHSFRTISFPAKQASLLKVAPSTSVLDRPVSRIYDYPFGYEYTVLGRSTDILDKIGQL